MLIHLQAAGGRKRPWDCGLEKRVVGTRMVWISREVSLTSNTYLSEVFDVQAGLPTFFFLCH